MATKKLQDLAASTNPNDTDIFIIEDTAATKKITFLNMVNKIKDKLGIGKINESLSALNNALSYQEVTIGNLNPGIEREDISAYKNKYEGKLHGWILLKSGTYKSDVPLFTLQAKPIKIIYFNRSDGSGSFYIGESGNVYVNGSLTISSEKYMFFNVSFVLR